MWEEIARATPVLLSSMFKFILGPVGGFVAGLNPITTVLSTVGGMMVSVVIFTFFGSWLRPKIAKLFFKSKRKFSKRNRRIIPLWRKYGLFGLSFLTPLILTPIGGTIFVVAFGAPPKKVLLYMLGSAVFWASVLTFVVYTFGRNVFPDFIGV